MIGEVLVKIREYRRIWYPYNPETEHYDIRVFDRGKLILDKRVEKETELWSILNKIIQDNKRLNKVIIEWDVEEGYA